jgi:hypothetical protein
MHLLTTKLGLVTSTIVLSVAISACGGQFEDELGTTEGMDESEFIAMGQEISTVYPAGFALRTLADLKLRKGPGMEFAIIATIPEGSTVKTLVEGRGSDGWYQISWNGQSGWSYGAYLLSSSRDGNLLAWGLHPDASDALKYIGVTSARITQTVGGAPASAGYHLADGWIGGDAYCAAVDLSTRGMTEAQIHDLLGKLGRQGFAAWYRKPGVDGWPSGEIAHIHAVYAGAPMKSQLDGQVGDWLVDRNGLADHQIYDWHTWGDLAKERVRNLFAVSN